MIHAGGCHCGNLRYALETALALTQLPLRACQCSFCRLHGARSTSDASGHIRFDVRDASRLTRYRFGLRTADFLICSQCGTSSSVLALTMAHSASPSRINAPT